MQNEFTQEVNNNGKKKSNEQARPPLNFNPIKTLSRTASIYCVFAFLPRSILVEFTGPLRALVWRYSRHHAIKVARPKRCFPLYTFFFFQKNCFKEVQSYIISSNESGPTRRSVMAIAKMLSGLSISTARSRLCRGGARPCHVYHSSTHATCPQLWNYIVYIKVL